MLPFVPAWRELATRAESRYRDGERRLPTEPDPRQRQLTRMANAASAAGLSLLMVGDDTAARPWFERAAARYRESYRDAPPGSWGRPIGAMKARILAADWDGATAEARWALDEGAADTESPIGGYAAALALLVLGRRDDARIVADALRTHERFPRDVADALAYLAGDDPLGYTEAIESVLDSFETRDEYLEDIPVADTVLVLQALARRCGIDVALTSALLP
jgi:hypothetical protein